MNSARHKNVPEFQVFRIDRVSGGDNRYGIDRGESWSVEMDATFANRDDAVDYVVKMNKRHCGYELGILYSNDKAFIAQRCTDSEWCHRQKYFLGRPDIDRISQKLMKDGVSVIRTSKL